MELKTQMHPQITTRDQNGCPNGFLIPIYNVNDGFFEPGQEPQQVYLTVVAAGCAKGPHLHKIRTGFFTCIKGNVRIVVRIEGEYREYHSGEAHHYLSVEIPVGAPALIQNLGEDDAFVLNMPHPAWRPDMNDEHAADFSDYPSGSEHPSKGSEV